MGPECLTYICLLRQQLARCNTQPAAASPTQIREALHAGVDIVAAAGKERNTLWARSHYIH